jgi:hypothetical protein
MTAEKISKQKFLNLIGDAIYSSKDLSEKSFEINEGDLVEALEEMNGGRKVFPSPELHPNVSTDGHPVYLADKPNPVVA